MLICTNIDSLEPFERYAARVDTLGKPAHDECGIAKMNRKGKNAE